MLQSTRATRSATAWWPSLMRQASETTTRSATLPRVLLLAEGGEPTLQALRCFRLAGAPVHVLGRPAAADLRWSADCRSLELFDFHPQANPTAVSAMRLDATIRQHGIDVVVPVGDTAAELLGRLRDALRTRCFPLASQAAIRRLNNLAWFYELARKMDLPMPRTVVLDHKHRLDMELAGKTFGFPIVVRPSDQMHGPGVIARSLDELQARVVDNPAYDDLPLIVQEHVPGEKVDLNLIAQDGQVLAHSTQRRTATEITFQHEPSLLAHARTIIEITKYSGPAHLKAIRDARDGRVRLLACRGRMWGSMAASAECGVNLPAIGVAIAMGEPVPVQQIPDGTTVKPSTPGLGERLVGLAGSLLRH
jgi:predicted ATP-grasp superfamily ATP-dependent carboligase